MICDTGLYDDETPAIITMLRGPLGREITITAADKDLHSGSYGGLAMNPVRVLARIIAALHDQTGRVTVPEFYNRVTELPEAVRAQWQNLAFNHAKMLAEVGLSLPTGEQDRTPLEMLLSRPTCEVNGISGGYEGEGFKTVLPSQASAKISFRLVGSQDPAAIRANFRTMVASMVPADCSVSFKDHSASPASQMTIANPAFEKAPDRAERRVAKTGGLYRLRRLDSDRRLLQIHPWHGCDADRLWQGRRSTPRAERKVRCRQFSPRHAQLGADSRPPGLLMRHWRATRPLWPDPGTGQAGSRRRQCR